jgi:hypothetical protein
MDEKMSTNIDDILDPNLNDECEDITQSHPLGVDINNINEMNEQQLQQLKQSPDLLIKNPNITNVQANVSVQKSFTDTFLTESNILLIIIIILAGLPQINRYILQILPRSFQNDMVVISLKAIILCVIYIAIVHYLL